MLSIVFCHDFFICCLIYNRGCNGNNLSTFKVGVRFAAYTLPSADPTCEITLDMLLLYVNVDVCAGWDFLWIFFHMLL